MIFLVQFGINKHLWVFQRPQSALALRARALLLVFEKFTRTYLFQIALEIMWLKLIRLLARLQDVLTDGLPVSKFIPRRNVDGFFFTKFPHGRDWFLYFRN